MPSKTFTYKIEHELPTTRMTSVTCHCLHEGTCRDTLSGVSGVTSAMVRKFPAGALAYNNYKVYFGLCLISEPSTYHCELTSDIETCFTDTGLCVFCVSSVEMSVHQWGSYRLVVIVTTGQKQSLFTEIQSSLLGVWQAMVSVDPQPLSPTHAHTQAHRKKRKERKRKITPLLSKAIQYNVASLCFAKNTQNEQSVCVCVSVYVCSDQMKGATNQLKRRREDGLEWGS